MVSQLADRLPIHELEEIGLRHRISTANERNPIRFHDDLRLLLQAGASRRLIARVISVDHGTVLHWLDGGMPTDQFSILVVNRWADDVRKQLGQESSP